MQTARSASDSKAIYETLLWQFKGHSCTATQHAKHRTSYTTYNFNALLLACRQAGSQGLAPSCNKLARMARAAVRTTKQNLPRPSPETPPKHCSGTAALEVGNALSTTPYPGRCGRDPCTVLEPGASTLQAHWATQEERNETAARQTRPPDVRGEYPPVSCSLGQQTSLYTA
jgi:hypothetical protein